jgi:hypothetical protein
MLITGLTDRVFRAVAALAMLVALTACSFPQIGPDFATEAKGLKAENFTCCFEPEKFYPAPFARLALALGNQLGPQAADAAYGEYEATEFPGRLTGKSEAHERIRALLQPFDLLIIGNTSYTLGRLMPGRFSHSMIYIGTEAELRAAGLWSLPEIVPHHDEIRAGKVFMEAATPDVHLMSTAKAFEVDRVVAIRPSLTPAEKRLAARRAFASIGAPFNFALGIDPAHEKFACTGLVDYAMPDLGLIHRDIYGQTGVLPDDIIAQAIRGGEKLKLLTYVLGTDEGYTRRSTFALMVDIAAYWGVPD